MHAENVTRLQEWIALPSIAAENRNYPQGPEDMAKRARDDGDLLYVRCEAVRAGGVEFTAARGPLGAKGRSWHRLHGPRRGQPKGTRELVPERIDGVQGGGEEIAGEPGAGVRGRGGD